MRVRLLQILLGCLGLGLAAGCAPDNPRGASLSDETSSSPQDSKPTETTDTGHAPPPVEQLAATSQDTAAEPLPTFRFGSQTLADYFTAWLWRQADARRSRRGGATPRIDAEKMVETPIVPLETEVEIVEGEPPAAEPPPAPPTPVGEPPSELQPTPAAELALQLQNLRALRPLLTTLSEGLDESAAHGVLEVACSLQTCLTEFESEFGSAWAAHPDWPAVELEARTLLAEFEGKPFSWPCFFPVFRVVGALGLASGRLEALLEEDAARRRQLATREISAYEQRWLTGLCVPGSERAIALEALGRYLEALQVLETAPWRFGCVRTRGGELSPYEVRRGRLLYKLGRAAEARACLWRVIDLDRGSRAGVQAQNLLMRHGDDATVRRARIAERFEAALQALEREPASNPDPLMLAGYAFAYHGFREGIPLLVAALPRIPEVPGLMLGGALGDLCSQAGSPPPRDPAPSHTAVRLGNLDPDRGLLLLSLVEHPVQVRVCDNVLRGLVGRGPDWGEAETPSVAEFKRAWRSWLQ